MKYLKYTDAKVVMAEVPDEVTLAINISGCPCHCEGCHSSYLADDVGKVLDEHSLVKLLINNRGVTCVAFMGGDIEPARINWYAALIKAAKANLKDDWANVKIAWYSGRQELANDIDLRNFDYIKVGPYLKNKGPLDCKTTNQKFYQIVPLKWGMFGLKNITYKFWKQ